MLIHVLVGVTDALELHLAASCECRRLKAGLHLWQQNIETVLLGRPHVPGGAGERWNDVGRVTTMCDDSVHLVRRLQLLTQSRDIDICLDECIEGVDALPGISRGMGILAVIEDVDMGNGDDVGIDDVVGRGMHHHRERGVTERSGVDQIDFAAELLLGRGAEHRDPEAEILGCGDQTQVQPLRQRWR